ncbi:MAG: hypothetical protein HY958_05575 [Bacteroidia bacterium]|nr:hypothetical protein [Bacteroidia bacterium]
MWYLIGIIILAAAALWGLSCTFKNANGGDNQNIKQDTGKKNFSKNDIAKRLEALSKSEAPKDLNMGAMCYRAARSVDRAEYVCPKCGSKTIYKDDKSRFVEKELSKCRGLVSAIKEIEIKLDESQFCKKCSPKITDPELCIQIKLSNETTAHISCRIDAEDILLIKEFTSGSDRHKGAQDYETPLKDHLFRLEELFGIKLAK